MFADDLRLLLMRPMAGAIDHLHSSELREAGPASCGRTAGRSIRAPVLRPCDELRGYVNGATRKGQLLGERRRIRVVAPVPVFVQSAGPTGGRIFLTVDIAFCLRQPL